MLSTRQAATPSEARADAPDALHVRTPQLSGHLWKRGFRFRRKWVRRWVALVGREVLYWAESDRPDALSARRPRGRAVLAPGMRVTVGDTEAQSAPASPSCRAMANLRGTCEPSQKNRCAGGLGPSSAVRRLRRG